MTNVTTILLFGIATIFTWASIGCCVVAIRMRYYPLLFLGVFSLAIGWLVASIQWMPAVPVGLSSAAIISLALYKWLAKRDQRPDVQTIALKHVLCWWVSPNTGQGSSNQR
jgi:hypothetical protein